MKGIEKAQMGIIAVLALMLVSIKGRLPEARRVSSGTTTLVLAGIVLLVAAGGASANGACIGATQMFGPGAVVTESCTLNDTMDCTGSGLIIGAEGITIDGNNFGITGSNAAWSYGIHNYDWGLHRGYHNVVIKNLQISGFQEGVCIQGTSTGPYAARVENNTIYNCTVHDNGANTAELSSGYGIHFQENVWNSTIDDCRVYDTHVQLQSSCDSPGAGIRLYSKSCYNDVTNCEVYKNDLAGIYSKAGSKYNYIDNNDVYENAVVSGNSFPGGIRMQCKNTNWWNVTNNRVWDNYGPGIFVGGQNCILYKNEVTGSKNCTPGGDGSRGDGIIIDRSDTTEGGRYNTLTANMVCDNEGYDIIVQPNKPGNTGDNNTCYTTSNYGDTGAGAGECTYRCFTVDGHCSTVNDGLAVDITNLETDDKWDANIATTNDDYSRILKGEWDPTAAGSADIRADETLRIHACDNISSNERACNVTDHDVTSGEITAGGFTEDLTLNHFCRNYLTFPYRTWEESNWSGPAVMGMLIDHYRDPPDVPDQTELNETGIGYNQGCNANLPYADPRGMKYTLNQYLHAYNGLPYVANYGIGSSSDIDDVLHYMCKWHYLGPGAAPVYGNYSNWMAVRGIHTDVKPTFTQGSYTIYGFWMNDPYNEMLEGPGGIGENTYKSVEQWTGTYHLKLNKSDVDPTDTYYDKYVAVCEPPEADNVEVTLAKPKPRLADAIRPALTEEILAVCDTEQPVLEMTVKDEELLKIIRAAIDGVTEELLLYDVEFADVFAKTTAGNPVFVAAEAGDYYLVPFNTHVVEILPVKKAPVGIKKSGITNLKEIEHADEDVLTKPTPIEPIKIEKTLIVVLVDGEDGSFMEASWVADPVKYLPVSKTEALKLALREMDITDKDSIRSLKPKPTIEIVYRDASPYYPDWKITIGDEVYFVGQDGTVSHG